MTRSVLASFHPAVRTWFERRFGSPTDAQRDGWPQIVAGNDTLISAPTGSGKTLAAFLVSIDRLMKQAEQAPLPDEVQVVYVSPLKALSSDIQRNLEEPLTGINEVAAEFGLADHGIRTALRTGDTTPAEREQIVKHPPHILITTPESLYLMVTAERSREILRNVKTVIVDEIHALIRDKRGSHLALTLARLDHIANERPSRVGLSATVKPISDAARFLVGADHVDSRGEPKCIIVNSGHQRDLEITIEVPPTEMQAVASGDQWKDIYDRLAELIKEHRTTLVFVNTRRLSERVAYALAERLGEEHVGSHHGSLSKDRRLSLERRLKAGEMKALVATASLELGIDIGTIDLVCQLESPRSITTFLQRVGRSGHALGLTPRGALFPMTRDELVECAALVRAVRSGRLDRVNSPVTPLDILAQQLVAEVACEPWAEDDLFALVRRAAPYSTLARSDFDEVVELMSEGIQVGSGTVASYIHRDRINGILRGRRGARSTAIQCGGAIPEIADYRVIADPEGTFVGTLDEDFSVESMAGDIILLGTTSWRIRRIESNGTVRVEDAHGAPPTVPFWLGEAPGRTLELSEEISKLRTEISERLPDNSIVALNSLLSWLEVECGLPPVGAEQLARYIRAEKDMLGVIPTQQDVVFERFFDESGGQQLVVHAPFGARINRAWGLALRKRFCVGFDFELQAAANDDAMLLSIGPNNSFPLEAMFDLVKPGNVQESVEQALLVANAPMWGARWRWNATRALAILRQRQGKRVPPPIQRMKADDLMAAVFPVLVACQENLSGPIELPDHPLTRQTMNDCLYEAMDIDGLKDVLERVERGEIQYHSKDTTEPSPMAHEILNSKPYTYLDDAPLEERRARAVALRRSLPENARDLGVLDDDAIERVIEEAAPDPRDPEELHDVLLGFIALRPQDAGAGWQDWFDELVDQRRAAVAETADGPMWFAAENLRLIQKLYPNASISPEIHLPATLDVEADEDAGRLALVRGHIECLGPVTPAELSARTGLALAAVNSLLAQIEAEGSILRGHFRLDVDEEEWCDRRLLARIHRYTLDRLRQEIEPVSIQDLVRFLLRWQHVATGTQLEGKRGLLEAVTQLQGFDIPAVAWERHILPARIAAYKGSWLDELCFSGDITWARLGLRKNGGDEPRRLAQANSATPISLARRVDLRWLIAGIRNGGSNDGPDAGAGRDILDLLQSRGALFYDDIVDGSARLPTDVERGLWELVARGLVTADGFQALRSLMASTKKRNFRRPQRAKLFRTLSTAGTPSGRWSILPQVSGTADLPPDTLPEAWAELLLFRYGVVFRDLTQREGFSVPWRDILRVFRRMEAQGVIRGGRFVAGVYGEQYARPEAVEALRKVRRIEKKGDVVRVSAVDPLNLTGTVVPGARIPAVHTNSVLYRDGLPIDPAEVAQEPLRLAVGR
jgi:ATP-dependent Lhr-like helicase